MYQLNRLTCLPTVNVLAPCRRGGARLADLMREMAKVDGLHWIRILYAYPSYFSDELIDEIASNPKVCR
jgi:ribosomal protein S12 methylthiotransferase